MKAISREGIKDEIPRKNRGSYNKGYLDSGTNI
jgi:hypothetical protein